MKDLFCSDEGGEEKARTEKRRFYFYLAEDNNYETHSLKKPNEIIIFVPEFEKEKQKS